MPSPSPCHSHLAAAPRRRPVCGAIVQLLLCALPSAAALSRDSSRGGAAAVDVHAEIAEEIVRLHPEEESDPVDDDIGPVAEGRVRGPVSPELQALLDRDPTFLAVADDDPDSMHDGDSGDAAVSASALIRDGIRTQPVARQSQGPGEVLQMPPLLQSEVLHKCRLLYWTLQGAAKAALV